MSSTQPPTKQEVPKPKRMYPVILTDYQESELMKRYQMSPYMRGKEKELLSRNLGLSERRVASWFTEKRRLARRMEHND